MRKFVQISLAALAIAATVSLAPAPAAAQYSPNYGGNCEQPLVRWRGAPMPCDGYGPRRAQPQRHVQPRQRQVRTTTVYGPPREVAVYRGTVAVRRAVARQTGPTQSAQRSYGQSMMVPVQ